MNARDELLKMVGVENFFDKPEVLQRYSKDFSLLIVDLLSFLPITHLQVPCH
jgi:hypothetical protein